MDMLLHRSGPNRGDLVFVNGACPTTEDYADVVAQRLYIMLRTFQGEWYLNENHGIPYLQSILGHRVRKSTVDRILQEKILKEEGVAEIVFFMSTLSIDREYECRFRVRSKTGELIEDGLEGLLI